MSWFLSHICAKPVRNAHTYSIQLKLQQRSHHNQGSILPSKKSFRRSKNPKEYVHKPEQVPGVVVAAYGERIKSSVSKGRCKHRLGLGESGSPFMSIPTLSKVLETLFDV